jgi:DNA-binding transcriptional LysR family regulator
MSSQEQLDRLRAGELEVGFVRLPDEDGWGRLILGTDCLALASADHGDPSPSDPADISRWVDRHDFVQLVTARGPGLAGQINRFCAAAGVRPGIVQEAHDLQTVLAPVAAGTDASFVPASAARIAPPPITITPLRHPAAEWRIAAVWNPGHPPLAASFLDLVRDGSAE